MAENEITTTRRVLPMPRYAPGEGAMVRSEHGEFVRLDDVRLLLAWTQHRHWTIVENISPGGKSRFSVRRVI